MPEKRHSGNYLLLGSAILLLIVGGILLYLANQQTLVIDVDGTTLELREHFETVDEALEAAGLDLRPEDFVWPAPDYAPGSGATITVRSAKPVELTVNGKTEIRWTLQDNLASFLAEQALKLGRSSRISVDGQNVAWPAPLADLRLIAPRRSVDILTRQEVAIRDGQNETTIQTGAASVGDALVEAGIEIYAADNVQPALNSRIKPDKSIVIQRATPVAVQLDAREISARSSSRDVAALLAELGVGLLGSDRALPGLDQPLAGPASITIERADTTYEVDETALPYSTQWVPLDTLEIDQRALVSAGSPGTISQLKRIDTLGSQTISPTVVSQWISQPAADEVIGYGTDIVVRTLDTPGGQISYWRVVRMRVTAYTAADAGKPRDHPSYGITASGRPAGFGVVAIDPKVVPFRSQVYVPGYGVAFAGDTGGGVKGRWIDLGYDEGQIVAWNGYVDVYYLTPVPEPSRINYLIPATVP
jgi:uncharacterized protein YabE (DUF348 family)